MTDATAILNRTGLTLGFVGSLFLAVGILGQDRIRRFEKSSLQTLRILINPFKFIKTCYTDEQPPWLLLILLPLSLLFYLLPVILEKHIGSVPVVSVVWDWFRWNWGLPGWFPLVIILPYFVILQIVIMRRLLSGTLMRHWWLFLILILVLTVYIAPKIPFIVIWFPCWFLLLMLTSVVFWIFTLPVQFGFVLQERLGFSGAFEPAGIVLLGLAFLLQLVATF